MPASTIRFYKDVGNKDNIKMKRKTYFVSYLHN
jgi:hypothetical protein